MPRLSNAVISFCAMHEADRRDGDRAGYAPTSMRVPGAVIFACGLVAALVACSPHKRTNLDYCNPDDGIECGDRRKVCEARTRRCIFPDGGPTGTGGSAGGGGLRDGGSGGGGITDGGAGTGGKDAPVTCATCPSATPICNSSTGTCQRCSDNLQCATLDPAAPFCGADGGQCLVCGSDGDCMRALPTKPWCLPGGRQCAACRTSADCRDAAPVCDGNHDCVACQTDNECASRNLAAPACRMDGACVECTEHADCKVGTKPICSMNACVPCTSDKQCEEKQNSPDPGVCLSHLDGHCASNSEVWYVQAVGTCNDTASDAGTAAKPFCKVEPAIAASPTKSILILRSGSFVQPGWTYAGLPRVSVLTVIGQAGAAIGPALGVGITITGGKVYIRGLVVTGMQDSGIKVSATAGETNVSLSRCLITGNTGGLFVNGAGFDISNSVFSLNRAATLPSAGGPAAEYGGVFIGGLVDKPKVFRHNTIYRNLGPGVVCGGAYPVKGLLVTGNSGGEVVDCAVDVTSQVAAATTPYDPLFDPGRPYRLTRQSPCVDIGTKGADSPPDDIDGNPRPSGATGISDCGAHEFQQ